MSEYIKNEEHLNILGRPVGEGGKYTSLDIRSVDFICFLKTSILELRMVEPLKMWRNSHFLPFWMLVIFLVKNKAKIAQNFIVFMTSL